jgi:phage tail tape-measure protein
MSAYRIELVVAVQGARRDTYPSGMARDMGGGMQVYVTRPGRHARREDSVKTLDDAPPDQIATVDQQREFAEAWRAEPNKQ